MHWMILPLKRYFDFKGRSRRKEYWLYTLFILITWTVLSIADSALGLGGTATTTRETAPGSVGGSVFLSGGILANLFSLATFIPGLAVSVRRLHDVNRTGWWVVVPLVPFFLGMILLGFSLFQAFAGGGAGLSSTVGGVAIAGMVLFLIGGIAAIVMLVWFCSAGTMGPNRYGEDPKGVSVNAQQVFG